MLGGGEPYRCPFDQNLRNKWRLGWPQPSCFRGTIIRCVITSLTYLEINLENILFYA